MSRGSELGKVEDFPKRLRIFFWVIIIMLVGGVLGFWSMSEDSLHDAFFRTIQTLAFMFEEDTSLAERLLEIFLAIVGVFLVWWVLWSTADMIMEGNLRKYLKTCYFLKRIRHMDKHLIIIGGGRVGEEIAKVISGKSRAFLIIDSDAESVDSLKKKGYVALAGNAMNEDVLKKASVGRASKLIIAIPNTEDCILITLAAKRLNPGIEIHARCENPALIGQLKQAGAKVVTVPEIVAADKIAQDLDL